MPRQPVPPLAVTVCWDGVVVTVTVTGELDVTTSSELTGRLFDVAAACPGQLVLDLGGLVFVDAAGARALDRTCKLLEAGCPVLVRAPRPSARVFGLTGTAPAGDLPRPLRG